MCLPVLPTALRVAIVVLTAGVILAGSLSVGNEAVDRTAGIPFNDELLHIAGYALLALTVTYAWLPERPTPMKRGLIVFAAVLAYGLAIEGLQSFVPTRQPDVGDAVADGLGASMAFVWDALVARWTPKAS